MLTFNLKFPSSAYLSVVLQLKDGCFDKVLLNVSPVLTAPLLRKMAASVLTTTIAFTAAIVASMAA